METQPAPKKSWYAFGDVAEHLLSQNSYQNSLFLVSSDSRGEGMFVSEVAMRERRPGHVVLRASKVLSRSNWSGSNYELLYRTPDEVMTFLHDIPVGIVVVDHSVAGDTRYQHNALLIETLIEHSSKWELIGRYPFTRRAVVSPAAVSVYRLIGHERRSSKGISIGMVEMLGRTLNLPNTR
jgi:hypothetical protein